MLNARALMVISVLLTGCNAQEPVAPVDGTDPFLLDVPNSGGLNLAEDSPIEVIERRDGALHCWLVTFEGGGHGEQIHPTSGGMIPGAPIRFPPEYQWTTFDASTTTFVANNSSGDMVAIWAFSDDATVIFSSGVSRASFYYASSVNSSIEALDSQGVVLLSTAAPANIQPDGFTVWDPIGLNSGANVIAGLKMRSAQAATGIDDFEVCRIESITVEIDIKPGSDPNCFNNDGHGVIPVAILGSSDFDVTQIDPATVQLEGLAVRAVGKADKLQAHIEDANGDGFSDLVVQIEDMDGVFTSGTGTATLTGQLLDGTPIEGSDSICIVP